MAVELRDYQQRGVDEIRAAYKAGHKAPLYVCPTGGGKTVVFSYVTAEAARRGNPTLVLAHRDVICEQISAELTKNDVSHGLAMQGYAKQFDRPVQVGMMQTVANRLEKFDPALIVVDEAHRAMGATYRKILESYPKARRLLVTATPQRTDGKPLGDVADSMVLGPSVKWLMDNGFLSRYRLFCPPPVADLSHLRTVGSDYNLKDTSEAINRKEVIGDALEHYKRICHGVPFVVFTPGTKASDNIARDFTAGGVPTMNIDGTMDKAHIKGVLAKLKAGEIMGVSSCNLISEGFDLPMVTAAILLRPTLSLIVYLQQVGRVLRPALGKNYAIILDHVGNSIKFDQDGTPMRKHGLPDEDRQWSLLGRKKKKKVEEADVTIKRCPECQAMYAAHHRRCPFCEHVPLQLEMPEIEVIQADLTDVTADKALYEQLRTMNYQDFMHAPLPIGAAKEYRKLHQKSAAWAVRATVEKHGLSEQQAVNALGYKPGMLYYMRKHSHG